MGGMCLSATRHRRSMTDGKFVSGSVAPYPHGRRPLIDGGLNLPIRAKPVGIIGSRTQDAGRKTER